MKMLPYLLSSPFIRPLILVINPGKIGHDNGYGKSDHKDSRKGTNASDEFTQHRTGNHVAIPETREVNNPLGGLW